MPIIPAVAASPSRASCSSEARRASTLTGVSPNLSQASTSAEMPKVTPLAIVRLSGVLNEQHDRRDGRARR